MSSCRVKPVHPTLPVPARTTRQLRRLPSPESLARSSSSDCLVKRPSFFAAAAADFGNGFSRSSRLAPVRWPLCTHRRLPDSIAVGERALGSSVVPKLPAAMCSVGLSQWPDKSIDLQLANYYDKIPRTLFWHCSHCLFVGLITPPVAWRQRKPTCHQI